MDEQTRSLNMKNFLGKETEIEKLERLAKEEEIQKGFENALKRQKYDQMVANQKVQFDAFEKLPEMEADDFRKVPKAPGYEGPDWDSKMVNRVTQAEAKALANQGASAARKMAFKNMLGKVAGAVGPAARLGGLAYGVLYPNSLDKEVGVSPEEAAMAKRKMIEQSDAARLEGFSSDLEAKGGADYINKIQENDPSIRFSKAKKKLL